MTSMQMHMPKGWNLFLVSLGAAICCFVALLALAISWLLGGGEFAADLGGGTTGAVLGIGCALFAALAFVERPDKFAGLDHRVGDRRHTL